MTGPLKYTTTIAVTKTAAEMSDLLRRAGADRVTATFNQGRHVGLEFTLITPHGLREFVLPIDASAVLRLLKQRRVERRYQSMEQAERVAWRVAKDWLAAQLAIIEAQMTSLDEVMLPYLVVDNFGEGENRKTLYTAYKDNEAAVREIES